ncbi:MAG: rRNA maturation RNase YbeY [bacterium]|nr:rRNA maturation RNase YbeY [bacterium]
MKIAAIISSQIKENISKPLIKKILVQAGGFFTKEKGLSEVGVVLVGDGEMKKLNQHYRGKDKTTNVLSFPTKKRDDLGDIFISLPEAKREAKKYGLSLEQELARLVVHGFLHLLGYDHIKEREAKRMEKIEDEILDSSLPLKKGESERDLKISS